MACMCLDCGCRRPNDDHGNPNHIVLDELILAAEASDIPVSVAANNVARSLLTDPGGGQITQYPLIVSDIDNTLARLAEVEISIINTVFAEQYKMSQWTSYNGPFTPEESLWLDTRRENPTFFTNLPPDTEAINALQILANEGYPIAVGSNRPAQIGSVSSRWLDDHNVPRDKELFAGSSSKQQLLAGNGVSLPGILFDDSPLQWLLIPRPGIEVWSPRRPWTPENVWQYSGVRVFDSWSEPLSWLGIHT